MSTTTRRWIMWVFVAAVIMIPPELAVYRAASTDDALLARTWVKGMSSQERERAALTMDQYPNLYRKTLFNALPASAKAQHWQAKIQRYVSSDPSLSSELKRQLMDTAGLFTADVYTSSGTASRARLKNSLNQVEVLLGQEAHRQLFSLGLSNDTIDSGLPMSVRVQRYIRGHFVASALDVWCNCKMGWSDCAGGGTSFYCSQTVDCVWSPFGCGAGLTEPCEGYCLPS